MDPEYKGIVWSVIIPTYNRADTLVKTLAALAAQRFPLEQCEVIIVDDGSSDRTDKVLAGEFGDYPFCVRVFTQEHKGPAAARNIGIRNARGELLLFLGDDIIADAELLEEHTRWHRQYPLESVGVLGFVTWAAHIRITPFMHWLENGGPQFHYGHLAGKTEASWKYFYTANVSVKKDFLVRNEFFFDESFPYAAFEDSELAFRLSKHGFKLMFHCDARGYHDHPTTLEGACRRMEILGFSGQILAGKVPDFAYFHDGIKRRGIIRRSIRFVRFLWHWARAKYYEKRSIKPAVFEAVLRYCWLQGCLRYRRDVAHDKNLNQGLW